MSAPPNPSFWVLTTPETAYPALEGDVEVDVCVIGAGIAGLTAATILKREGKTVAVVESKRIVHGATGCTTAEVTSGHGAIYGDLEDTFGAAGARIYAQSNEARRSQARCLPRRIGRAARPVARLPASLLPCHLESGRAELGLSVPRVALLR